MVKKKDDLYAAASAASKYAVLSETQAGAKVQAIQPGHLMQDSQSTAELEAAFPVSRIHSSRLRWYSGLWLLYMPFGAILACTRFICLLGGIVYTRWQRIGGEAFASNRMSWLTGISSTVSTDPLDWF